METTTQCDQIVCTGSQARQAKQVSDCKGRCPCKGPRACAFALDRTADAAERCRTTHPYHACRKDRYSIQSHTTPSLPTHAFAACTTTPDGMVGTRSLGSNSFSPQNQNHNATCCAHAHAHNHRPLKDHMAASTIQQAAAITLALPIMQQTHNKTH